MDHQGILNSILSNEDVYVLHEKIHPDIVSTARHVILKLIKIDHKWSKTALFGTKYDRSGLNMGLCSGTIISVGYHGIVTLYYGDMDCITWIYHLPDDDIMFFNFARHLMSTGNKLLRDRWR